MTIHVTKRAIEWLMDSPYIYGHGPHYKSPINTYACGAKPEPKLERGGKCGVEDVRAMTLQKDYKVIWGRKFGAPCEPIVYPTCDHCRVLLDQAFMSAPNKGGKYLDTDDNGDYVWLPEGK